MAKNHVLLPRIDRQPEHVPPRRSTKKESTMFNKICTRLRSLHTSYVHRADDSLRQKTKMDKQPNGGKGKPITELPREDKNIHNLALIKKIKIWCVILDAYNNNKTAKVRELGVRGRTKLQISKHSSCSFTHTSGSKVLSQNSTMNQLKA